MRSVASAAGGLVADSTLRQQVQIALREVAHICALYQAIAHERRNDSSAAALVARSKAAAYQDAMQHFSDALTNRVVRRPLAVGA